MGYINGGNPSQSNYHLKGFETVSMGVEPASPSPSSLFFEGLLSLRFCHAPSLSCRSRAPLRKFAFALDSPCIPASQSPKWLINYPVKLSLTEFKEETLDFPVKIIHAHILDFIIHVLILSIKSFSMNNAK